MSTILKLKCATALIYLVALVITTGGCNKDEETATEKTSRLLQSVSSWKLNSLTVDGVDQTSLYKDMTLSIAAGTYSAQHGEPVWPATGTWKLANASTIDRDSGFTVRITQLDANHLTLSLHWTKTTFTGGRTASISGDHVFEMVK